MYFKNGDSAVSHVLPALFCLLFAGCAGIEQQAPEPSPNQAMPYIFWLQSAPPAELKAELTRLIEKAAPLTLEDTVRLASMIGHVHRGNLDEKNWAREVLGQGAPAGAQGGEIDTYLGPEELWGIIHRQREMLHERACDLSGSRQRIEQLEADIRALEKQIEELTSVEQQMVEQEQDQ